MVLPSRVPQLADLDLLLSVENYGSVGKAAQAHSMSQPAASMRLRAMERRLGFQLLERSPIGSQLTTEGEVLAKYARNVIDAVRELWECGSAFHSSEANRLRVACSLAVAEHLVPEWLNRASVSLGEACVEVQTGSADSLCDLARTSAVDLAFIDGWSQAGGHVQKQLSDELVARYICDDELVVVVGATHPWTTRSSPLTVQELASTKLVLRERGSGLREFTEELLGTPIGTRSYVEFSSSAAIKQAVATGQRATVISISSVKAELNEGRLHRVDVDQEMPVRPIYAVWSERQRLNPYAQELVEIAASRDTPTSIDRPRDRLLSTHRDGYHTATIG